MMENRGEKKRREWESKTIIDRSTLILKNHKLKSYLTSYLQGILQSITT